MHIIENSLIARDSLPKDSLKSSLCLLVNKGTMRAMFFDQSGTLIFDESEVCGDNHDTFHINQWIFKLAATEGFSFTSLRVLMINDIYMVLPAGADYLDLPASLKPYWIDSGLYKLEIGRFNNEENLFFPVPVSLVFTGSYPFQSITSKHFLHIISSLFMEQADQAVHVSMFVLAKYMVLAVVDGVKISGLRVHEFASTSDINYFLTAIYKQKSLDPHETLLHVYGDLDAEGKILKDITLLFSHTVLHKISLLELLQRFD
jgi:hypothetical protein